MDKKENLRRTFNLHTVHTVPRNLNFCIINSRYCTCLAFWARYTSMYEYTQYVLYTVQYTVYVKFSNVTLNPLQAWQALFLCGETVYFGTVCTVFCNIPLSSCYNLPLYGETVYFWDSEYCIPVLLLQYMYTVHYCGNIPLSKAANLPLYSPLCNVCVTPR